MKSLDTFLYCQARNRYKLAPTLSISPSSKISDPSLNLSTLYLYWRRQNSFTQPSVVRLSPNFGSLSIRRLKVRTHKTATTLYLHSCKVQMNSNRLKKIVAPKAVQVKRWNIPLILNRNLFCQFWLNAFSFQFYSSALLFYAFQRRQVRSKNFSNNPPARLVHYLRLV